MTEQVLSAPGALPGCSNDAALGAQPEQSPAEGDAAAWMHEDDPSRVISAIQKAQAEKDGGASASSVKAYSIRLTKPHPHKGAVPDVDQLAQFLRRIHGRRDMGAGDLAERIVDWLGDQAPAPAPEESPCACWPGRMCSRSEACAQSVRQAPAVTQPVLAKVLEDAPDDSELEGWRNFSDILLRAGGRDNRTAAQFLQNAYLYGSRLRAALAKVPVQGSQP